MKKTKIFSFMAILILISFSISGCKFESLRSPEKLLEMPIYDESSRNLYLDVKKLTPADTSFILPKNVNDIGKINTVNLDNNENKELVVFKKKENDNHNISSIYMYIFQIEDGTIKDDTEQIVRLSGDSIKYANFVDINGDNKNEIIVQVVNKGFESIYIFQYNDNIIKKIAEYSSSKESIRLNYFDYNNDGKKECLALVQDLSSYTVKISEMKYSSGKIYFLKGSESQNIDNMEKVNILDGFVSKDSKGSVIVYQNIAGSSVNQIIVYRDGKFEKGIDENDEKIKNPISLRVADIDNDEIFEIPKMEFKYSNNTTNEARVISWYKWNGKIGSESSINLADQIFYCYDYNFKIVIPDKFRNKFFIRQNYEENKSTFQFYVKDESDNNQKLFNIDIDLKEQEGYDKNKIYGESNVLYELDNYIYYISDVNESNLKKYGISIENIKKSFYQINK